jgi:hypothetical protein
VNKNNSKLYVFNSGARDFVRYDVLRDMTLKKGHAFYDLMTNTFTNSYDSDSDTSFSDSDGGEGVDRMDSRSEGVYDHTEGVYDHTKGVYDHTKGVWIGIG